MGEHEVLDCVVVGAGPAGTAAAIYLGRFRRSCLLIDAGESRMAMIPRTRNHPGFPYGIGGAALLRRMHHQAGRYGVRVTQGLVEEVARDGELFRIGGPGAGLLARTVVLACGVLDKLPNIPEARRSVRRGLLRVCPICDGYETIGQAVGVIGDGDHGGREAMFLTTYARTVSLIHTGPAQALSAEIRAELASCGIELIEAGVESVVLDQRRLAATCLAPGGMRRFDAVYAALGCAPRTGLARGAGAAVDDQGRLLVDDHQQTSVKGLYACGDLVRGLNQISTAEAEGAIAATHVHNTLRGAD